MTFSWFTIEENPRPGWFSRWFLTISCFWPEFLGFSGTCATEPCFSKKDKIFLITELLGVPSFGYSVHWNKDISLNYNKDIIYFTKKHVDYTLIVCTLIDWSLTVSRLYFIFNKIIKIYLNFLKRYFKYSMNYQKVQWLRTCYLWMIIYEWMIFSRSSSISIQCLTKLHDDEQRCSSNYVLGLFEFLKSLFECKNKDFEMQNQDSLIAFESTIFENVE